MGPVNEEGLLYIEIDKDGFIQTIRNHYETNIFALPSFYNQYHKKFIGLPYLFSIYQDSYLCILCGLYHPSIMLMGQLFEATLKEIILIHDDVNNEMEFGGLVKYAKNINNSQRKGKVGPLLPNEIINIFIHIKNNIRNPYMHLNYGNIFHDEKIKGFKFPSGANFEELLKNAAIIKDKLLKGEIVPVEIDPKIDKVIADSTKRDNDSKWAIEWAWELFPFFELCIDEYLTESHLEKFSREHKNDYNSIPFVDVD